MSVVPYLSASVPLRLSSAGSSAAIPVLAVQELHSVAIGGALVAASLAPSIIAAPLAGALLDRTRHPTRLVLLAGAVTAAAFALTALVGIVPLAVVAVALVLAGAVTPFFMGGLSSFATDAIGGAHDRAFGADALSYNIGSVAGPALAAASLAIASGRIAMVVLAVIAAGGLVGAALLRLTPHPARPDRPGVVREIGVGIRYLATHRPLAVVTASSTLTQLGQGALPIAAIAIALSRVHDAGDAAWIVTSFAIGALVGSLVVTARPIRRIGAPVVMIAAYAATGILTVLTAAPVPFAVVIGLQAVAGAATGPGVAAMFVLRNRHSPGPLRSQVFTVAAGLRATAGAVGAAVAGLLPEAQPALLVALMGVAWMLSAALVTAYPRRETDATAPDRAIS